MDTDNYVVKARVGQLGEALVEGAERGETGDICSNVNNRLINYETRTNLFL